MSARLCVYMNMNRENLFAILHRNIYVCDTDIVAKWNGAPGFSITNAYCK